MKKLIVYALLLALLWYLLPTNTANSKTKREYQPIEVMSKTDIDPEVSQKLYEQSKKPRQTFSGGWCTSYVATKTKVTWRGNANRWITNSQKAGATVNRTPAKGAILVTNESRWGHVAYIEDVIGNKVVISEMNYIGRYKVSTRTLDINDPKIKGIIHN